MAKSIQPLEINDGCVRTIKRRQSLILLGGYGLVFHYMFLHILSFHSLFKVGALCTGVFVHVRITEIDIL